MDAPTFKRLYSNLAEANPMWKEIAAPSGQVYNWPESTYIAEPPFFDDFSMQPGTGRQISGARTLAHLRRLGHHRPHLARRLDQADLARRQIPAGSQRGGQADFNSYGSRRGNHEVMMRGTFANVRIKNLMLPPKADGSRIEGGYTLYHGQADADLRCSDELHRRTARRR